MSTCSLYASPSISPRRRFCNFSHNRRSLSLSSVFSFNKERISRRRIFCSYEENDRDRPQSSGIQVYGEIERYNHSFIFDLIVPSIAKSIWIFRLLTETVKQSQNSSGGSSDWSEIEVCFVLSQFVIWNVDLNVYK